jgi:esterase
MSTIPPNQLHHRVIAAEIGHAPAAPLVLLHGLMGFSANWGKIWPYFQKERSVLVLDQRGHGRSAKPAQGYDPEDYARDLHSLLAHLGWNACHVVGHSMGGRVALRFASLFPEATLSLTLEDSGMEGNPSRVQWIEKLLGSIPTPFPDRDSARKFFEEKFTSDPLTGGFLHANLETLPDGTMNWKFHAPGMVETILRGRAVSAMEEFSTLKAPTLVVRGSRSEEFPRAEADRMVRARASVKFVEIEGAGHFVHAEKPAEFSIALSTFLKELEA